MNISPPFWHPSLPKAFLMDWDGVIAETKLDFTAVRERYYGGKRAMLLEDSHRLSPEDRESLMKDLYDLEMEGASKAAPVPGALEFLSCLEDRDIPYCIVSRNCLDSIKLAAKTAGIALPEQVWARDNAKWLKPDPRALHFAADMMGADPYSCAFVGDFLYDMQGARRAGMRAVLVRRNDPLWEEWYDVAYENVTDLLDEMTEPVRHVPWEYREIEARRGEKWLLKAYDMTLMLPESPSPTIDAWLVRAAAFGIGTIAIPDDRFLEVADWKESASFDPAYMGMPMAEVVRAFLRPRYPMVRVVEGEEGIKGPRNSLDLRRFIERKIY
jgi:HAD superfamily hydrolase (TIGR01509 family)